MDAVFAMTRPFSVGNGKLDIGFFSDESTDTYPISANTAAEKTTKKADVALSYFDGDFAAATETDQMVEALASGTYIGWTVGSTSPDACNLVQGAAAKEIFGGLDAVRAAGKLRRVKVYDFGGSSQFAQDGEKGRLQLTTPDLR
ncbi:MAG: hypothetical protein ACRDXC_09275 [Acidimicrobiales bacterium]